MDIRSTDIEKIVRQVLESMGNSSAPAASASASVPTKSRVAMLTKLEHFDIQEYPIPELGDDDVLVKVEGCGVCGTDAHEFKRDPFSLIPVVLGHEGISVKSEKGYVSELAKLDNVFSYKLGAASAAALYVFKLLRGGSARAYGVCERILCCKKSFGRIPDV